MRKFIDIVSEAQHLKEFQLLGPFRGEGGGSHTVIVTDIEWDTDGEEVDLPEKVTIEVEGDNAEEAEENIADTLSDEYGWCVSYFNYRFI